jgi:hypothetical protein
MMVQYRTRIRLRGFSGPVPDSALPEVYETIPMLRLTGEPEIQRWYDYWRFRGLIIDRRYAMRAKNWRGGSDVLA